MNAEPEITVTVLSPPIILEVHSERLLELTLLLDNANFAIRQSGAVNRFRIDDKAPKKS
jgi:hypothetical protein